jgi:HlyD family secretion protein
MVVTKDKNSTQPASLQPATIPKTRVSKKLTPWVIGIAMITAMGVGATYVMSQAQKQSSIPTPTENIVPATKVTALGRLEPQGEVIKLSVANAQDSRVNKLLVEEGDRIQAGQVIAILQGLDKKQAELAEAKQNLAVEQAKLTQIKAGDAKTAEITAQQANIARLEAQLRTETDEKQATVARAEAQLRNAEINYQRYQTLQQEGAESISNLDDRREAFEMARSGLNETKAQLANTTSTLQKQIQTEKAMLQKLREVRPVDVKVLQAQVEKAIAQINRIKAELDDFYVRAPIAGQVLKINTRIGEQVNTIQGIVELGRTNQMYAIAEVYETDVGKLRVSQRASVVSEHGGFTGEIQGTVEHIGLQIKKQDVLEADPAADKDARVVEVKVRIDPQDSTKVAGLTNLQVRISFDLNSAKTQ